MPTKRKAVGATAPHCKQLVQATIASGVVEPNDAEVASHCRSMEVAQPEQQQDGVGTAVAPVVPAVCIEQHSTQVLPVVVTGGAAGADARWVQAAVDRGMRVRIKSFMGHRCEARAHRLVQVEKLSSGDLETADAHLLPAARALRRPYKARSLFVQNLLRRNWHIVRRADIAVGVGLLATSGGEGGGVGVHGGTAWAIQCFAAMWVDRVQPSHPTALPLVFWDAGGKGWVQCWYKPQSKQFEWKLCRDVRAAVPCTAGAVVACVGSRDLPVGADVEFSRLADVLVANSVVQL